MVRVRIWEDGLIVWFRDECWHRANGPAMNRADGCMVWYWYDREVTEFELLFLANKNNNRNGENSSMAGW